MVDIWITSLSFIGAEFQINEAINSQTFKPSISLRRCRDATPCSSYVDLSECYYINVLHRGYLKGTLSDEAQKMKICPAAKGYLLIVVLVDSIRLIHWVGSESPTVNPLLSARFAL